MRLVHKNSTGQQWVKPEDDELEVAALHRPEGDEPKGSSVDSPSPALYLSQRQTAG